MHAKITVKMDNAAFEDTPATELARILRTLAEKIENEGPGICTLRDVNGNTVGEFKIYP